MKGEYNIGDHITTENGKLKIKNDKKQLIKLAEKEIEEWQKVKDKATKEIYRWTKFAFKLEQKNES